MFNEATFWEILLLSSGPKRSITSRNVASLNILSHDVMNVLYYEHWTDWRKHFYVYIFYNVEWVEVRKMNEFFERNCVVKWVTFFASFRWLWGLLKEKTKLIDKLQIWGFSSFLFWSKKVAILKWAKIDLLTSQSNLLGCNLWISC